MLIKPRDDDDDDLYSLMDWKSFEYFLATYDAVCMSLLYYHRTITKQPTQCKFSELFGFGNFECGHEELPRGSKG